jgi:hypothetical protein
MATRAAQPDEVRADTREQLAESRSGRVVRGADVYEFTSYCRHVRVWRSIMNSCARYMLSLKIRVFVAVVSRTLAPAKYFVAKKVIFSNCKSNLACSGSNPTKTANFFSCVFGLEMMCICEKVCKLPLSINFTWHVISGSKLCLLYYSLCCE